jgi:micrococcal nuclease
MLKHLLKLIYVCIPLTVYSQTQIIKGKLIGIGDGDTFTLLSENKTQYKIRLNGIDCPEKGQDFGKKAKDFTYRFCAQQVVVAELLSKDKYGRNIANVTVNGVSLNQALLAQGLAWHYTKYSQDQNLAKLEQEARSKSINIWSVNKPMPPWIYRKRGTLVPLNSLQSGQVYICASKGSKTYHKSMCSGLSKCAKGIKTIDLKEAIRINKKECGYCYTN